MLAPWFDNYMAYWYAYLSDSIYSISSSAPQCQPVPCRDVERRWHGGEVTPSLLLLCCCTVRDTAMGQQKLQHPLFSWQKKSNNLTAVNRDAVDQSAVIVQGVDGGDVLGVSWYHADPLCWDRDKSSGWLWKEGTLGFFCGRGRKTDLEQKHMRGLEGQTSAFCKSGDKISLLTVLFTPNQAFQSHVFMFLAKPHVSVGCPRRVLHSSINWPGTRNPHVCSTWGLNGSRGVLRSIQSIICTSAINDRLEKF